METTTSAPPEAILLTARAIEELPAVPLAPSIEGVVHRVLWRNAGSMAGVMDIAAGHELSKHSHRWNDHHLWVLDGAAEILGRVVGPGAYVHVPAGVEHAIDARTTAGCTVYYLYLQPAA